MTHRKEAQLQRLSVLPDSKIRIRLRMSIINDDTNLEVARLEDAGIEVLPTDNHDEQLSKTDTFLGTVGFPSLTEEVSTRIIALCETEHTVERVEEFRNPTPDLDMELRQETRLSIVSILRDGMIGVRLSRCLIENGVVVSPAKYHRFNLYPLHEPDGMLNLVSNDLKEEGYEVRAGEMERIKAICICDHTPLIVAAYKLRHWTQQVELLEPQKDAPKMQRAIADANVSLSEAQAAYDVLI
jgi:hypothetical protein